MLTREFLALVAKSCDGGQQVTDKITARLGGVEGFLDAPADYGLAMQVSQQIGNVDESLREEAQAKLQDLRTQYDLLSPTVTTAPGW